MLLQVLSTPMPTQIVCIKAGFKLNCIRRHQVCLERRQPNGYIVRVGVKQRAGGLGGSSTQGGSVDKGEAIQ